MTEQQEYSIPQVWVIRAGKEGEYEERFLSTGSPDLGGDYLGDLRDYATRQEIAETIGRGEELSEKEVKSEAKRLWRLRSDVCEGDIVALPRKKPKPQEIALGVVASEYRYQADAAEGTRHSMPVDWKHRNLLPPNIQQDLYTAIRKSQQAVSRFKPSDPEVARRLLQIIETGIDPGTKEAPVSLEDLAEKLLLDVKFLRRVEKLLHDKKQVIFQGPPGTGKTYVARELAKCLAGGPDRERVTMVQFHPFVRLRGFRAGFPPDLGERTPRFQAQERPSAGRR